MATPEQARSGLKTIARLAEDHADALKRAFGLLGDDAITGPVGTRLFSGARERHGAVRRAFLDAFSQVERVAAKAEEPADVPRPQLDEAPTKGPSLGEHVGGKPEQMTSLASELGNAGRDWEDAGETLSRILNSLGLDSSPGRIITGAGTWATEQKRAVTRSREELLKAPPVNLTPLPSTSMTTPAAPAAAVPDQEPEEEDGDLSGWLSDKTGEFFDWADEQWLGVVEGAGDFVGLDGEQVATYYQMAKDINVFDIATRNATEGIDWAYDKLGDTVEDAADAVGLEPVGDAAKWYMDNVASPLVQGFTESSIGLVEFGWNVSPQRMLLDPVGSGEYAASMGTGIVYGVEHPVEFLKAVAGWDTLTTDPARWVGQLGPDAILAVATAGTGAGASAANRLRHGLDAAEDLASLSKRIRYGEWAHGARRRPRDILDVDLQDRWAQTAYDDFLKDDGDIDTIADHLSAIRRDGDRTGFSREEITEIKDHVFRQEHPIEDYDTGHVQYRKFDPDPEIADAWIRLRSGDAVPEDYLLLEHELREVSYLRTHSGATYQEAHAHANQLYNWESKIPLNRRQDIDTEWR